MNLVTTVLIGGQAAAVMGSQGLNTPPHIGLHPSDPYFAPPTEIGEVMVGSMTVLIGGQGAATAQSTCSCCSIPGGSLVPSVQTVLIG